VDKWTWGKPANTAISAGRSAADRARGRLADNGLTRATRSLTPDRPFLIYYSSSTGRPPHTPPKSWLEKGLCHSGFDQGWDVMREQILQRQKEMGIVPPDTKLAAKPDYIQAWDSLSDDAKTVYAPADGGLCDLGESADHEVGRLVDAIENLGELDNTLFF
jgi:arylsulfatase A-like enzyme